ncbi:MAG: hypothetical protein JWN10_1673, partial [Solirubrobacterales bacterium]|nr:hypothetical protein [Solirubrobacterales bacterium]
TDSYAAGIVKLGLGRDDSGRPVSGPIGADALEAIATHGAFRADESIEILDRATGQSTGVSYARPRIGSASFPSEAIDAVLAAIDDAPPRTRIALNAAKLHELARAMGEDVVELSISGSQRAVGVRGQLSEGLGRRGALMPVRVPKGRRP